MADARDVYALPGDGTSIWDEVDWSDIESGGTPIEAGEHPGSEDTDTALFDTNSGSGSMTIDAPLDDDLIALVMYDGLDLYSGTLIASGDFTAGAASFAGTISGGSNITVTGTVNSKVTSGGWDGFGGEVVVENTSGDAVLRQASSGAVFGSINIDNGDTITYAPFEAGAFPLEVEGDFTFTSGDFDGASKGANIAGDILVASGGNWANSGTVTQTASGNVNLLDTAPLVEHIVLGAGGITSTLTNTVNANKVTLGTGDIAGTARNIIVGGSATPENFWVEDPDGTLVLGKLIILSYNQNRANASPITFTGATELSLRPYNTKTLTFDGAVNGAEKPLTMLSGNDGVGNVVFNVSLTCGDITIGSVSSAAKSILVDLSSGTHTTGDIGRGNASDTGSGILFGTSVLNLREDKTLTGTGLSANCTNTSGVVIGGTIDYLDIPGGEEPLLHLFYQAAGTDNTNVTELAGIPMGAPYAGVAA